MLAIVLLVLGLAACGGRTVDSESRPAAVPWVPLKSVVGTFVGSMATANGIEAVVLQIQEIVPLAEGFIFSYSLSTVKQTEYGQGFLEVGETTTRVCFEERVCGWLLAERARVRIVAEVPDLEAAPWALERQ